MKKRLLIVYTSMIVGGATTALLSLLTALDAEKYAVDLLLYENDGPRQAEIPSHVRVLAPAKTHVSHSARNILQKALSPRYLVGRARALWQRKVKKRPIAAIQLEARQGARYSRRVSEQYDVAISFLEFWPLYYTAHYVQAKRKIAWIHVDYSESGMRPRYDIKTFARVDTVVLVSRKCLNNFIAVFPERIARKAVFIENLTSQRLIRAAARETVTLPFSKGADAVVFVSVCRVVFRHKGLDRGVEAFRLLKQEGLGENLYWVVIGDGEDAQEMRARIDAAGLGDHIAMLGQKLNPLPYMAACDAFFLPSRFEGKPLAVTEAMTLGIPALVARYASAEEQIEDGVDGLIAENTQEALTALLRSVSRDPGQLARLRARTAARNYDNLDQLQMIERLIDA